MGNLIDKNKVAELLDMSTRSVDALVKAGRLVVPCFADTLSAMQQRIFRPTAQVSAGAGTDPGNVHETLENPVIPDGSAGAIGDAADAQDRPNSSELSPKMGVEKVWELAPCGMGAES